MNCCTSFPTSPYTLPQGRAYIENFTLSLGLPGNNTPRVYNWPFLIRYGITDNVEFRLSSQGITSISALDGHQGIDGFSPIVFGTKIHLWGTDDVMWLPCLGIDAYIQTPIASESLRMGTQCIASLLLVHNFPGKLFLEWNIGFFSRPYCTEKHTRDVATFITWALHKELAPIFTIFFQGFYTTPKYPAYPVQLVVGIGIQSPVTQRLCIYANYNWSVYENTNPDLINVGFTVAF